MKNIVKFMAVAAVALALNQTVQAVQIHGNIGFDGDAVVNSTDATTSTGVVSGGWEGVAVTSRSGDFTSVAVGTAVTMLSPWTFNSGPLANFWTVGGFTFNLSSSASFVQQGVFMDVIIIGTVTGNGFDATPFFGTFQIGNPSTDGVSTFSARLSFNSVPDGATTVLLLGATLSGLAFAKRKLLA